MQSLTDTFTLSNGIAIPCVGFGTWQTPEAAAPVAAALQAGYRHIDTAAAYGNEASVAAGIARSGVARGDIFITTKLWNSERGYDSTIAAFEESMRKLELDSLDLYLIHWPANAKQFGNWAELNAETWRAFEDLYTAGKIKAIGLSNFTVPFIEELRKTWKIAPMVNQIEFHPGYMQPETVAYCQENGIQVQAWSPLGSGRVLSDPTLAAIASTYDVSVAQLCVRWVLQHNMLPLPKSVTAERITQNADVFDFEISAEDMATIDAMPETGFSGLNPADVDF